MKLVVFGATGTIGRLVVERALGQGHQVTAFARKPETLKIDHRHLTRLAGDVLNASAVAGAIAGQDGVVVALGAGRQGGVRSVGTEHIIEAMERYGVDRLVCLSTLGAGDSCVQLNFFWKRVMFGMLLKEAYADHQAQERLVMASKLDWTIVRPGGFTNGPATGTYAHGFGPEEQKLKLKISRADVANFMMKQLVDNTYLHKTPGLSY